MYILYLIIIFILQRQNWKNKKLSAQNKHNVYADTTKNQFKMNM
jgi:hypothetical protein